MPLPVTQLHRAQTRVRVPLGERMEEVVRVKICKCNNIHEAWHYALSYFRDSCVEQRQVTDP